MEQEKNKLNFSEVEIEKAKDYAAEDADITLRLYKKFQKSLKSEKLKIFMKFLKNQ